MYVQALLAAGCHLPSTTWVGRPVHFYLYRLIPALAHCLGLASLWASACASCQIPQTMMDSGHRWPDLSCGHPERMLEMRATPSVHAAFLSLMKSSTQPSFSISPVSQTTIISPWGDQGTRQSRYPKALDVSFPLTSHQRRNKMNKNLWALWFTRQPA